MKRILHVVIVGFSLIISGWTLFVQYQPAPSELRWEMQIFPRVVSLKAATEPPAMTFADSVQTYYGERNTTALQRLLKQSNERAERLLCQYRLYPLTQDKTLLEVPTSLEHGTAREFALLAGLWGYRAAQNVFGALGAGHRSLQFLEKAKALDPDDPFVLLIDAQSLLFRPALFGGDDPEALRQLRILRRHVAQTPSGGISLAEVNQWIWYALKETKHHEKASALRHRLFTQDLPPLYRDFLLSAR